MKKIEFIPISDEERDNAARCFHSKIYKAEEFDDMVQFGELVDHDGFGYLVSTEDGVSDIKIVPSTWNYDTKPTWCTHVAWYDN